MDTANSAAWVSKAARRRRDTREHRKIKETRGVSIRRDTREHGERKEARGISKSRDTRRYRKVKKSRRIGRRRGTRTEKKERRPINTSTDIRHGDEARVRRDLIKNSPNATKLMVSVKVVKSQKELKGLV